MCLKEPINVVLSGGLKSTCPWSGKLLTQSLTCASALLTVKRRVKKISVGRDVFTEVIRAVCVGLSQCGQSKVGAFWARHLETSILDKLWHVISCVF